MKIRRVLAIIMTLALAASLIAACGQGDAQDSSKGNGNGTSSVGSSEDSGSKNGAGGGSAGGSNDSDSGSVDSGPPDNSDLLDPDKGPDLGIGPIGHDLDELVRRMGPEYVSSLKIGVSLASMSNDWFISYANEMKHFGELYGFEVKVLSAENDPVRQSNDLKSFQSQQMDGIVAHVATVDAVGTTITELHDAGIPIVNTVLIPDYIRIAAHLNSSEWGKGAALADMLAKDAEDLGRDAYILMLGYSVEMPLLQSREDGFMARCEEFSNVHVVDLRRSNSMDGLLNVALETMTVNEHINTVFAPFMSGMVTGVTASDQLGRNARIYGVDADEANLRLLGEGKIHGILVNWAKVNASLALFTLLRCLNGEEVDREIWEPDNYVMGIATAENYEIFIRNLYPDS